MSHPSTTARFLSHQFLRPGSATTFEIGESLPNLPGGFVYKIPTAPFTTIDGVPFPMRNTIYRDWLPDPTTKIDQIYIAHDNRQYHNYG